MVKEAKQPKRAHPCELVEVLLAHRDGHLRFARVAFGAVPLLGVVDAAGSGEALGRRAVGALVLADGAAGSVYEREECYERSGPALLR